MTDHLLDQSLREVADSLRERKVSPVDLLQAALRRIRDQEPRLNAFVRLTEERAHLAALQAERELAAGIWRGELHGVPIAVKDLYDCAGLPTSCSSKVRHDHLATQDSACVERLSAAGAVIVGMTHTHEFAYGIMTPTTGNPWDVGRIPGGSSGGSGATVAARGCFMAMGTDTGGSIRIPAAVCGVVGLKPTFGRVSRHGIASLSWSLDHAGPLARTVGDCAATLNVLAGYDPRDPGSADVPAKDYLAELEHGVRGIRLGVPRNFFFDHVDPEVEKMVREVISTLETEGAEIIEVDIPMADMISPVEFGLCMPEASAYHRDMIRTRADLYEPDVRTFLEAGMLLPAVDYIAAQRQRTLIQREWQKMFQGLDAIIGPSVPVLATGRDEMTVNWPDGFEEPISQVYVRLSAPANVTGLPSVSVPCGFGQNHLPAGFQVIGRPFGEARILRIARAYERLFKWMSLKPPC
ncbi:MAG: amidase [Betaproteobacteria bacterium]|nr:amidase [Betaproteobacteria bacterium]NBQ79501.1 amidase [Betaproteobacteria bacterium]NBS40063.1 amidase [Betaproteobacteria bacterium]NBT82354.1 amidase [Betaproteobacteria bacterium]NDC03832.1 amidase [Betaproteobacteria bacterium]